MERYGAQGVLTQVVDPYGNETSIEWFTDPADDRVVFRRILDRATGQALLYQYRRDPAGLRLLQVRDARNNLPSGASDEDRREIRFVWDERTLEVVDVLGADWRVDFDRAGYATRWCEPEIGGQRWCTSFAYERTEGALALETIEHRSEHRSEHGSTVVATVEHHRQALAPGAGVDTPGAYDYELRIRRGDGADEHFQRFLHDDRGAVVRQYAVDSTTSFDELRFDEVGRLGTVREVTGRRTRFAYDARGNLLSRIRDPGGLDQRDEVLGYDSRNRPEALRDPLRRATRFVRTYGPRGGAPPRARDRSG